MTFLEAARYLAAFVEIEMPYIERRVAEGIVPTEEGAAVVCRLLQAISVVRSQIT